MAGQESAVTVVSDALSEVHHSSNTAPSGGYNLGLTPSVLDWEMDDWQLSLVQSSKSYSSGEEEFNEILSNLNVGGSDGSEALTSTSKMDLMISSAVRRAIFPGDDRDTGAEPDPILTNNMRTEPLSPVLEQTENQLSSLTETHDYVEPFEGFDIAIEDCRAEILKGLIDVLSSDDSSDDSNTSPVTVVRTRSQGPVKDLPNVQERTLERRITQSEGSTGP